VTPENTALAAEIAARFGETGERPRAQIARMIGCLGEKGTLDAAALAERVISGKWTTAHPTGTWLRLRSFFVVKDGVRRYSERSPGGVFFACARHEGERRLLLFDIDRRTFFRCFTDRPPKVRTPKAPPAKAPKLPRMPRGAHVTAGNVRRQPARAAVPEVYVVRGRAGAGR